MATKPRKWPSYALAALETSLVELHAVNNELRTVQHLVADDPLRAVIVAGDIRDRVTEIGLILSQAKAGTYERIEL